MTPYGEGVLVDGALALRDGRDLAWREYGGPEGAPVLRVQGTPASRVSGWVFEPLWREMGLRVLMIDRPGYGGSTRLPGRGISVVTDDFVELLDQLGLERVPVMGGSGGGPHVLALCALHPDRVAAASVVVGTAPLNEQDVPLLVGLNAEAYRRVRAGSWGGVLELCNLQRKALLEDPLAGFRAIMDTAPASDHEVMSDPRWQKGFADGIREALRPGAEGWADELSAILGDWDFAVEDISLPVVWWHGRHDANAPLPAVERLIPRMPSVQLRLWESKGHLESFRRERELLQDLLSRT
jgi:pimeloyl-ACP methyl ester carboxylesterase